MAGGKEQKLTLRGKVVLVTGAGGFIGSHLTERLVQEDAIVRAFVRYNSRNDEGFIKLFPGDVRQRVEIICGDVRELKTVRDAVRDVQFIFHLAALVGIPYSYRHPQEVVDTNIIGTSNVLLSAKDEDGVERIVLTSTSEVYGTAQYVPIDEKHPLQPQSPYAATKIAADALGISFHRSFGLPVTVIRPFNAYGPRQSARAVIPTIITQALAQEEIKLGALSPTRDFTFVSDTVEGFIKMAESSRSIGEVINVGSGKEVSIGDLARKIISLVGKDTRIRQDDVRLRPSASEVERLCADNSKAKQFLGWEPRVSLDEGLAITIDWIAKSLDLYRPERYIL